MLERLTINLSTAERLAVEALAKSELRSIREQIRLIVRHDLQQRGLLVAEVSATRGISSDPLMNGTAPEVGDEDPAAA